MKLSELMTGYTPKTDYEGWVTNDDYVFAIDLAPGGSEPTAEKDFAVVEMGIAGLDAQLNPCWAEHNEDWNTEIIRCNRRQIRWG